MDIARRPRDRSGAVRGPAVHLKKRGAAGALAFTPAPPKHGPRVGVGGRACVLELLAWAGE